MKPKDIQRDIRSRHIRMPGDSPNLGRMERMRDADLLRGGAQSRRRSSRDGQDRSHPARMKAILNWSIGLGAVALAVIGTTVILWLRPQMDRVDENLAVNLEELDMKVRVASKFASPSEEAAVGLVKRALAIHDPAQVAPLFHMGSSTAAEVIDFIKAGDSRDGRIDQYQWLSSMDTGGISIEGVLVNFKGAEGRKERLVFLTPDANGVWKLDFEAFARIVKPSWKELLENGAAEALVRVVVARDSYYNGPFSDEKEWVCYGIASPDMHELLRGYCKVGSPEAKAMEALLADGASMCRATLQLRRVNEAESRQFEITRILAKDWVVPNLPAGKS